jgi:hypothetical protein
MVFGGGRDFCGCRYICVYSDDKSYDISLLTTGHASFCLCKSQIHSTTTVYLISILFGNVSPSETLVMSY